MITGEEILAVEMTCDDARGVKTVRQYLGKLLQTLWDEGESFSGKRPFGNSGWEYDLYKPLIKAGKLKGSLDDDGYIEECDAKQGHKLVALAIKKLTSDDP